ncbi:MAG: two-component system, OmpR family, sensor histidine kinase MtrB, partial [Micromonosporaceae bacterium]|nr:two-component system, OmpR family, sensor histidine kinase MtrB [Micromonosporaceae bacterium]
MTARTVAPGRLQWRLTVAFVAVAGVSAAVLAVGAYLMVRQARLDDSLRQAAVDTRYQLVLASQFLPLDDERSAGLLANFEGSGRHVLLTTTGGTGASNATFDPTPDRRLRAAVAAGQLAYQRTPAHLLVVGGRIPGSTAELYVVRPEEQIQRDLAQLRYALLAGWLVV